MYVIGLTGGIGAGKSTVAAIMADLGAEVIDADKEGHASYKRGTIGWGRIVALFGTDVLDDNGEIDRQELGSIVFGNSAALALLNSAIHPLIRDRVRQRLQQLRNGGAGVAVVDAAVLYQAGWDDLVDEVWVVTAPYAATATRLEARGIARSEARRRMAMQDPPEQLAARADVVIENTGSLAELQAKVTKLWNERISLTRQ